jgi:hypothetical protein
METDRRAAIRALMYVDPSLAAWVQTKVYGKELPAYERAELYDPDDRPSPDLYDLLVLLRDRENRVVHTIVFAMPEGRDREKPAHWSSCVGRMQAEFGAPCSLVVFVPDDATGAWYDARCAAWSSEAAAG